MVILTWNLMSNDSFGHKVLFILFIGRNTSSSVTGAHTLKISREKPQKKIFRIRKLLKASQWSIRFV